MNSVKSNRGLLTIACIASGMAAIGAGTCVEDILPAFTACQLTILNDCPVINHGIDVVCGSVKLSKQGFTKSDPYQQVCAYEAQYKNGAGECKAFDPPVYGTFTQQCHRSSGEGCKQH